MNKKVQEEDHIHIRLRGFWKFRKLQ